MWLDEGERIGIVSSKEGDLAWLLLRVGMLTFADAKSEPYVQMVLYFIDTKEAYDDFQQGIEISDQILKELSVGTLNWYGNTWTVGWLAGGEADAIRQAVGWARPRRVE